MNICRSIIESHRGRLSFENRPDGGAVFIIQLTCTA
jgi:signal transduction histidine kinase